MGAMLAVYVTNFGGSLRSATYEWQTIFSELLGSSLLTFIYLSQADPDTKLSGDAAIFSACLAAAYVSVVFIASAPLVGFTPINPAIALAILYAETLVGEDYTVSAVDRITGTSDNRDLWIWLVLPYAGALLAAIFFECVYRKHALDRISPVPDDSECASEGGYTDS